MYKPNNPQLANIPKIEMEGILGCLEPQTDCRYYHGSGLIDRPNIEKIFNCQVLMTNFCESD